MVLRSCAAFCIEVYRDAFTKAYNVYDEPGVNYSMAGKCTFCNIAAA